VPSGQTHDRVTLWSLPVVAGLTFTQTRSSNLTLLVTGGFFLGGLIFGPDLDIYSRQYQRWGLLRWIWLPYQKSLRHRSLLSHGFLLGTTIRLVYLAIWVVLLGSIGIWVWAVVRRICGDPQTWQTLAAKDFGGMMTWMGRSIQIYLCEWLALFLGLELGAMSHSLCDWGGSAYKRFRKQGWKGVFPSANPKKRKRRG
jgi:uncharacterized metal-binding protein